MEQVISCWCKRWKLEMAGEMALNLRVSLEVVSSPLLCHRGPRRKRLVSDGLEEESAGQGLLTMGQSGVGMHSEQGSRGEL